MTTEFMTPHRFAKKVGWEGGILDALEYGLKSTHLDPDDEASRELRAAWAELETAYAAMQPLLRKVERLIEDDEDDEDDQT